MLKQVAGSPGANLVADVALIVPRQVWLAGLGAAVVTREWARNDAGHLFRALVKEGSHVEARAMRSVGRGIDSSITLATATWNRARAVAQATVNGLVESTAGALPRFNAFIVEKRAAKPAARKPRAAAKRAVRRKSRRSKGSA